MIILEKQLSLLLHEKVLKLREFGEEYDYEGNENQHIEMEEDEDRFAATIPGGSSLFEPSQNFYADWFTIALIQTDNLSELTIYVNQMYVIFGFKLENQR